MKFDYLEITRFCQVPIVLGKSVGDENRLPCGLAENALYVMENPPQVWIIATVANIEHVIRCCVGPQLVKLP